MVSHYFNPALENPRSRMVRSDRMMRFPEKTGIRQSAIDNEPLLKCHHLIIFSCERLVEVGDLGQRAIGFVEFVRRP